MKATDLRIGNKADLYGSTATIQGQDFVNHYTAGDKNFDRFKPIKITKEWLLDFGLGLDPDYENTYVDNTSLKQELIIYDVSNKVFMLEGNKDTIEINHIKHVHQLQNIYYILTGKELEYKPL